MIYPSGANPLASTLARLMKTILCGFIFFGNICLCQTGSLIENDRNLIRDALTMRRAISKGGSSLLRNPTLPPSLPLRLLPEWAPAEGVFLAFDRDVLSSIKLNIDLKTTTGVPRLDDPQFSASLADTVCRISAPAGIQDLDSVDEENFEIVLRAALLRVRTISDANCPDGIPSPFLLDQIHSRMLIVHDYLDIASQIAAYTKVAILVHGSPDLELSVDQLRTQLASFSKGQQLIDNVNVSFIQAPLNTKWIRDYGPLFVVDDQGKLSTVDTMYQAENIDSDRSIRSKSERRKSLEDLRPNDDALPTELALRLRQSQNGHLFASPLGVYRPPISLDGGDVLTDGAGTIFTSVNTLRDNGGDVELVNAVFRHYLGATHVVYFQPLPGNTVKHIDMFFQPISENIFLLGDFTEPAGDRAAMRLQVDADALLEQNLAILSNHFQGLGKQVNIINTKTGTVNPSMINIVRVPLAPIRRPFMTKALPLLKEIDIETQQIASLDQRLSILQELLSLCVENQDNPSYLADLIKYIDGSTPLDADDYNLLQAIREELQRALQLFDVLARERATMTQALATLKASYSNVIRTLLSAEAAELDPNAPSPLPAVRSAFQSLTDIQDHLSEAISSLQIEERRLGDIQSSNHKELETAKREFAVLASQYPYGSDIYVTHLNLLQVQLADKTLVILPHYSVLASDGVEEDVTKLMKSVFRQAGITAIFLSAESDRFIEQLGSIHCLTKILPRDVQLIDTRWATSKEEAAAK